MVSRFYQIPGTHRPSSAISSSNESSSLLSARRISQTYFNYQATPEFQKVSSKYDPDNPNKDKLGTYDGVFVPTALNVLSILMFLRFGFILGQLGIICTIGLLLLSYTINLLTTLSISAISTNGTVRGGGAYYMISRSLGPEFGGSIGLVFFLGQVFNAGMNAVGIIEPLLYNLGYSAQGEPPAALGELLPRGHWHEFTYATVILFLCFSVAFVGSQTVSRAGNILFLVLAASIFSIPLSALIRSPFTEGGISYIGPSWQTFHDNLLPHLTKGAAGSLLKGKETFNDLFGVFFPATAGIFAGAGMSSELRKPSKSIPKGTLWGLLFTFICYAVVVFSMGCSIPRRSLYDEVQIIQTISSVQWVIFMGEMATSLFSIIVGMLGAAYVLEAIAKDNIIPGLEIFAHSPLYSLIFTWILTQLCLFSDVNKIATFITMTFLMTFVVMNLACFLLGISSAPNFRPSFKYFNRYTTAIGALLSVIAMLIVDGISASVLFLAMILLFLFIHYFSPPKSWGDVSQSLIYHQVRKYLLRLRQDNVKYWRPQILLFVDNPRTSWNLIRFCNHLKKGGLYILGHVAVTADFPKQLNELKTQQKAWMKIRDMAAIKAFVQVGTGPSLIWGIRNVFIGSGLGGMKPNITVVGFFDLESYRKHIPQSRSQNNLQKQVEIKSTMPRSTCSDVKINVPLPTDECKNETKVNVQQWVQIVEDLSLMQSNIAIAHGFKNLEIPNKRDRCFPKKTIDLYPIQMCGKVEAKGDQPAAITTNFDTYTLILQLAAILVTVPEWKRTHSLRVILFVEQEYHRTNETQRMKKLLQVLRIDAEVLVVSLDQFRVYNTIVKGDPIVFDYVNSKLADNEWWKDLVEARDTLKPKRRFSTIEPQTIAKQFTQSRKYTSGVQKLGVSFTMNTRMPTNRIDTPCESEDSDLDTDLTSIRDAFSASTNISVGKDLTTKSKTGSDRTNLLVKNLQSDVSTQSLRPVFSSNTLPRTRVVEDGTGEQPTLIPIAEPDLSNGNCTGSGIGNGNKLKKPVLPELSPCCSKDSLVTAMQNLGFNDLPSTAQHLVLNDVMTQMSKSSDLIFSTLPVPALGTHEDHDASLQYVEDLDIWLECLPPCMLINSQTMTVTTAL
ncbi:CEI_1a_G0004080.mRNA.1.CDS.1 [Saccharomyces cerevisiae]|nr:EM14S01-3B_G0015990.mRNA.1.CDS.1 [Saccharomyces cerevisiae]CAI4280613.1 AMH_1a_G0004230.mRNA.1.CDS.1 [Saccharomyces cerevisiae]CAI4283117.1 CEI_1a_G0004080.mRNA.1.CDS.1 [Saccharomyces cerevisiae]CAI6504700.1 AMH_1a_G0004230.mRNA.1.CDS.1 [Saccharomyces cerevisiae]CAI7155083.1 CEI_1a_G0004080.mRNA.1.CDS.1 [Saccharomyces cerevisiae]